MTSEHYPELIAIDGPAASGKSTIGQMLAQKLNYLFLDTGSMYRAITLAVHLNDVDVDNETAVVTIAETTKMEILPELNAPDGRLYTVLLDGKDVTWEIRSKHVEQHVSLVSSYLGVRHAMVYQQQLIGQKGKVVMVGRDIGTVVMPDAPLKLYIVASPAERARRRWLEQQERGGLLTYETILEDVIRRDKIDGNRQHAPMKPATDAIMVDTTDLNPKEIVDKILSLAKEISS